MGKEYDMKYTWVIKNFSSLQCERIYSSQFVVDGCKWRFLVYPKGYKDTKFVSLFLAVADSGVLPPSGWRRHTKFRLTIVNQLQKKLSHQKETQRWFEEDNVNGVNSVNWGFPKFLTITELHAKNSGFLVNGELMVVAEINILEVIGKLDFTEEEETSPVTESMNFNEFEVFSSQADSLKRLFDRHPSIASNFGPKNPFLKTAYMSLLLGVTKTLSQSPTEITKDDMVHASAAVISLKVAGFELDWLENKLKEIKENKERVAVAETRIHEIDEKLKELKELKELEELLKKEKTDILASNASLLLDDVF